MDKNDLFDSNKKLVYYVYNKYFDEVQSNKLIKEDLIQEGFLALWRACSTYAEGRSAFCTYATRAIYNSMLVYAKRKHFNKVCKNISIDAILSNKDEESDWIDYNSGKLSYDDNILLRIIIQDTVKECKSLMPKYSDIIDDYIFYKTIREKKYE